MTTPADLDLGDTIDEAWVDAVRSRFLNLPARVEFGAVTGATSDANGDIAVTYATPFTTTPVVFLTRRGTTTTHFSAMLSATSTTGFSARMFSDNARQLNTAGSGFDWIAIGS